MEAGLVRELSDAIQRLNTLELMQFLLIVSSGLFVIGAFYVVRRAFQALDETNLIANQANSNALLNAKVAYVLALRQADSGEKIQQLETQLQEINIAKETINEQRNS